VDVDLSLLLTAATLAIELTQLVGATSARGGTGAMISNTPSRASGWCRTGQQLTLIWAAQLEAELCKLNWPERGHRHGKNWRRDLASLTTSIRIVT
jgi:hypothetical protein